MSGENKNNEFNLFLGIDTHYKSWKVAFYTEDSAFKTKSMEPDAKKLRNYLDRYFKGWDYYSIYEAGFCGFSVHRSLEEAGIKNIIINPADLPTSDKEVKRKSDKIDCQKLARALRNGEVEGIYIPSEKLESDRQLLRYRNKVLLKEHSRAINQIKSFLKRIGIEPPKDFQERWSKKYENWLTSLELDQPSDQIIKDDLLDKVQVVQKKIKSIENKIKELANSRDYKENLDLLMSIPGIGLISAMTILTEVGDITRFKNLDQLCAFIGLMPNTSGSGEKEYVGNRTNRGNKHLFWIINQCAWRAKANDPALLKKYQQLCQRMDGNKAIVRIMKTLVSRIKHVLKNKEKYQFGIE